MSNLRSKNAPYGKVQSYPKANQTRQWPWSALTLIIVNTRL